MTPAPGKAAVRHWSTDSVAMRVCLGGGWMLMSWEGRDGREQFEVTATAATSSAGVYGYTHTAVLQSSWGMNRSGFARCAA